jgi:hypothetical protein
LRPKRKIVEPDASLLRPLPGWVLCNELPIRVRGIRAAGTLPLPVLTKFRHAHARLRCELTLRVTLNELTVRFDRVSRLGRPPILLLAAATCDQQQH